MKPNKVFIIALIITIIVFAGTLYAEDFIIYDGESNPTDLDRSNGGSYYEKWWGGDNANSLTDSSETLMPALNV